MKKASGKLKSLIFNEVFKNDVSELKELKTEQRKDLDINLETTLKRLYSKDYSPPLELPGMLNDLSKKLKSVDGKKVYGFMPHEIKQKVSEILKYVVTSDKLLSGIYDTYCDTQKTFINQYVDDAEKIDSRMNDFKTSFLYPGKDDPKTLHNIIIKYAAALNYPLPVESESDYPAAIDIESPVERELTVQKENANFTSEIQPENNDSNFDYGEPPPEFNNYSPDYIFGFDYSETAKSGNYDSNYDFGEPPPEFNNYPPDYILDFGYSNQNNDSSALSAVEGSTIQKEKGSNNLWSDAYKNARAYLYGQNCEQDYEKAYNLMKQEAEKGNALALYDVGFMHLNGLHVEMKSTEAQVWFAKAYDAFILNEEKDNSAYLQYRIGKMHRSGYGVDQSGSAAAEWFQKFADQGNQYAQYSLGSLYYSGKGVDQDYEKALSLYKQSASKGNVFASYELGRMYESGTGVSVDKKVSYEYYRSAYEGFESLEATTHEDKLSYRLGKMNLDGKGVPKNEIKAAEYFEKAAKLGNANAQYSLAKLWLSKDDYADKVDKAIEWLEKSAEQDNSFAKYTLGTLYLKEDRKNVFYVLHYLKESAAQGNQFAQYSLGKLYLEDKDVKKDIGKALEFLLKSADQSNQFAQYTLGKLYLDGKDVPKDINKAINYFIASAGQGNQFAQYTLGKLYFDGKDVPKDIDKAITYLKQSANQGNQFAQYALGKLYFYGNDVPKDKEKAIYYLNKSAGQGNEYAKRLLDYINSSPKRDAAYVAALLMRELAYAISRDAKQEDGYYNNKSSAFHMSQVRRKFTIKRKRQPQRNIADDISF
jgi:TPR repeat protein